MTAEIKLFKVLDKLLEKCQARNISITLAKENGSNIIKTAILTKHAGYITNTISSIYDFFWQDSDLWYLHKTTYWFSILLKTRNNSQLYLEANDYRFLEIVHACRSLEELTVKNDLLII